MSLAAALAFVLAQDAEPATAGERAFNPRYEFNLRMRELDLEWLSHRDASSRARALAFVARAGDSLRAGDPGVASREIDNARRELRNDNRQLGYSGLAVVPDRRLFDTSNRAFHFLATPFYVRDHSDGSGGMLSGRLVGEAALRMDQALAWSFPSGGFFDLTLASAGDHEVWTSLSDGSFEYSERTMTISIVEKRDERLAALERAIAALPEEAPRLERETASELLALLESLATGSTEETDYPGARLLAEAEQVVAAASKGGRWYGPERAGEFFLALPTGAKPTRARLLVPAGLSKEKPAPLVVALHGRVFSEHTWFECYGAGEAVKQSAQRKWIFAAPRLDATPPPPIASIVDALAAAYPVDRSQVFLIGHSMGGGIGLAAVRASPRSFRAFAAIGAGQALDDAAALTDLPIFIAAGDNDFARAGAEALHKSLAAAGSTRATLKVYPTAEHWMTVADSLPDVFAYFDAASR
jgi:pimeloyl-ACP methyl ester carboxylesterase